MGSYRRAATTGDNQGSHWGSTAKDSVGRLETARKVLDARSSFLVLDPEPKPPGPTSSVAAVTSSHLAGLTIK